MVNNILGPVLVSVFLFSACTWVKPEAGTEAVALVKPEVVQDCKRLGKSTVGVKNKVGFINRKDTKVWEELLTLARNEALSMQADTLVAEGTVSEEGKQAFSLYKCR
ncbi:DUF4156 domain-containing protein [Teredinibacter franksiae]|uniref:DUF4156 domain-containing protein n=1 Tax=Teredinibacter franksiae TaxID=2761453 RepID=UPI00162329EC|nr:DUF4156 domain-containing protein [Teredinibacter franksiae]